MVESYALAYVQNEIMCALCANLHLERMRKPAEDSANDRTSYLHETAFCPLAKDDTRNWQDLRVLAVEKAEASQCMLVRLTLPPLSHPIGYIALSLIAKL